MPICLDHSLTWSVREPRDDEKPFCRLMLPAAFSADGAPELLVAVREDDGRILGLAAIIWRNDGDPPAFRCTVHVDAAHRRRGIGRSLIAASVDLCSPETGWIRAHPALREHDPAEAFLAACGFSPGVRTLHFETSVARVYTVVQRVAATIANRDASASVRLIPLSEAPMADVAALWLLAFPGAHDGNPLPVLQGHGPEGANAETSIVAVTGADERQRIVGIAISRYTGDLGIFDVLAVHPDWRHRGLGIRLIAEATRCRLQSGDLRIHLFCTETTTDVVKLMERASAVTRFTDRPWVKQVRALPG